jgi:acyl-CoA thioesterase
MLSSLRKISVPKNLISARAFSHHTGVEHQSSHDHGSHKFNKDTQVTKVGENKFTSFVTNAWSIGDAPNGGYLMAIAISAARECINFHDPLSVTAYYLSKTQESANMDIEVEVLSSSNSTSTVQMTCSQDGVMRSRYLGTFGDLKKMKGISHSKIIAPAIPAIKDCVDANVMLRKAMGDRLRIANEIEFRVPKDSHFANTVMKGKQGQDASYDCWLTFGDPKAPCLRSLAFFCDAPPPPVINITPSNWVPTLEYTVHFWAKPEAIADCAFKHEGKHWIRGRFHTNHVRNSMLYTDGELWSADGETLLATSRQMARVFTPRK